jgi:hypothetical protein
MEKGEGMNGKAEHYQENIGAPVQVATRAEPREQKQALPREAKDPHAFTTKGTLEQALTTTNTPFKATFTRLQQAPVIGLIVLGSIFLLLVTISLLLTIVILWHSR